MPYTRYEADKGNLLESAEVEQSQDSHSTAIEASDQTYVALKEKGDGVSFKVNRQANALTVRYTVPDGASGQQSNTGEWPQCKTIGSFVLV